MSRALIGATGFVGGNLLRQAPFDARYHSRDIEEIRGRTFDWLVCAGAPAEKWRANQEPEQDRANLERLKGCLEKVSTRRAVLISTVDVYPSPIAVDEEAAFEPSAATPYGYHRFLLEDFFRSRFDTLVVRLPGLFGHGLKKNVVYDLLNDNALDQVHPEGLYQYYPLDRLWQDLMSAWEAGIRLLNLATEPVATETVAREVFGRSLTQRPTPPPARYDFRTRHAAVFGGKKGYMMTQAEVLDQLRAFVTAYRGGVR